jgi:hypothetical protein
MSQVTDTAATRFSVPLLAWAALALATMAVAVVLILAVTSGGQDSAPTVTAPGASGVRYDGGPEEGTRGPFRYDGGPKGTVAHRAAR